MTETLPTTGSVLAGYRLERKLGEGGMGAVYLARNPDLPRRDAIKVLSAQLSRDPEFRARFIREADVAARLTHPNIVAVYRRGETPEGQLWIAMQFVDGSDAEAALRAGSMTPQRAVHIIGEVAAALDYAHGHHVVHRDIKPSNFLLSGDETGDRVLLADFGIARALDEVGLTASGAVMSTVAYAAPEVLFGAPFDYRADLYSLGCSLFRLLTGKTPFWTQTGAPAVMLAHLQEPPPRVTDLAPQLPSALDAVIAVAMAKDPTQRFRTAGELASAATLALHGQEQTERSAARVDGGGRPGAPATVTAPWPSTPAGAGVVDGRPRPATVTAPWYPPVPMPPDPARPKPRRRVVAALLGVALVAAATVTAVAVTHSGADTAPPRPAAVPPVAMRDLKGLLPGADDLGAALGAAVTVAPVIHGIGVDSNSLDSQDCAEPWAPAQRAAYFGTGWQALELQSSDQSQPASLGDGISPPAVDSFVGVLSFPVADLAARFVDGQKPVWQRCVGRTVTFIGQDKMRVPIRFGPFAITDDNILTISHQAAGLPYSCGRALTVRNNIAIDVQACNSARPLDAAATLARQIAAKVPH